LIPLCSGVISRLEDYDEWDEGDEEAGRQIAYLLQERLVMNGTISGEIRIFAGTSVPTGWLLCDGQELQIAAFPVLWASIGTTYGGNGIETFALPDLRGRFPMHPGMGPGLSNRSLGQRGGQENVTLMEQEMPMHTHAANASSVNANQGTPTGNVWAAEPVGATALYRNDAPDTSMNPQAIGVAGGDQPHDNMSPFLCVNFIIKY
jgi:microcystin-dependent protein